MSVRHVRFHQVLRTQARRHAGTQARRHAGTQARRHVNIITYAIRVCLDQGDDVDLPSEQPVETHRTSGFASFLERTNVYAGPRRDVYLISMALKWVS